MQLESALANFTSCCVQLILKALEADLRKMMSPNTATNLRVRHEYLCSLACCVRFKHAYVLVCMCC